MQLFVFFAAMTALVSCFQARRSWAPVMRLTRNSGSPVTCRNGNGQDYRGTVSESEKGRDCLRWDMYGSDVLPTRLWRHNYCRNPDSRIKPWCLVRKGVLIVAEFCDIMPCRRESAGSVEPLSTTDAESTCGERPQRQFKIVGGAVASVESQPWIASIFQKSRSSKVKEVFRCGGSLISPCWVLTAAHCFPDGAHTSARRLSVILGKSATNETDERSEQEFSVEKVILHEKFDDREIIYNNDMALLKIRGRAGVCAKMTRTVRTICLPPANQMLPPGTDCEIAGFGKESERMWENSQYLRQGTVKLLAQSACTDKDHYGSLVTGNMFCAGSPSWSIDSCKGDSGGPLVCEVGHRRFLFGIISWGEGCGRERRPGVYTRVTNYNEWIAAKTGLPSITSGSMYPQK